MVAASVRWSSLCRQLCELACVVFAKCLSTINITLGLPFIRISPDHGVAENITGKKIANPKSLIESVKFFNYIK